MKFERIDEIAYNLYVEACKDKDKCVNDNLIGHFDKFVELHNLNEMNCSEYYKNAMQKQEKIKTSVKIFSDGSSRNNPGISGYGTILVCGDYRKEISEGFKLSTNNRMELLGVISGLEALKKENLDIEITSDSKYVVDSVSKGWVFTWEKNNFKDRKNTDLWKRFLIQYKKHNIKMNWIKGHNEHPENERCDVLATTESAKNINLLRVDEGYKS